MLVPLIIAASIFALFVYADYEAEQNTPWAFKRRQKR